ncbi:hypothetical protein AR158_c020L [Paramecium bursaria Chlorella virus AR158]|uniref:hypothetical protein n=1 Tax=Paramecium bursaria Chlorella virus AR158 TaxID=380598 RepID=UPI00015AA717|nr:hypothetical protein AR158_c020L [Paramecium bursaria Chlorella virus AR158]ABU43566.1 hypothetical protein AR158_c020L [Paramecium bursaria Chlorella virus AR158]
MQRCVSENSYRETSSILLCHRFPCESLVFFALIQIIANTVDCRYEFQILYMFHEIFSGITQTLEFFDDFIIFVCDACLSRSLRTVSFAVII